MTSEHTHEDDIFIGPGFAVLPFKDENETDNTTDGDSSSNTSNQKNR